MFGGQLATLVGLLDTLILFMLHCSKVALLFYLKENQLALQMLGLSGKLYLTTRLNLYLPPTAFRAIKKEDPEGKFFSKYDLSSFESLFLAGERADPDTIKWAENLLRVPVIDHWWQTETSWAISSNCTGIEMMETKYGSACKAVPGYDVKIIKPDQSLANPNEMGDIVVKLPLPPGTFPTLWNADKRYKDNYMTNYEGYYQTYDARHIDEDGYIWIMSRTDDIINVAGHRLSTGAIEEVLSEHQSVAECAVLGIADKLKGQLPIGLVV